MGDVRYDKCWHAWNAARGEGRTPDEVARERPTPELVMLLAADAGFARKEDRRAITRVLLRRLALDRE